MMRIVGLLIRCRWTNYSPCWRCGKPSVNNFFCSPCRLQYSLYVDPHCSGVDEMFDDMTDWFGEEALLRKGTI